jgi:TatD DNase family protein
MPEYFDIHSHLEHKDFDIDRAGVIGRLNDTNTLTVTIGTDIATSQKAVELAKENKNIFSSIGIHPRDDANAIFDEKVFEKLVVEPKVVSIGECGLDYFRLEGESATEKKRQKDLFEKQIHFAVKHGKPIMIHCRDAYEDATDILEVFAKQYGDKLWGDAHFFAGDIDIARRLLEIGFTISFTGVITFTHDYDEIIRFVPLDKILSETDAPYVAPVPYRGKRCEPSFVSHVTTQIAIIRGENLSEVKTATVENALNLFKIKV